MKYDPIKYNEMGAMFSVWCRENEKNPADPEARKQFEREVEEWAKP